MSSGEAPAKDLQPITIAEARVRLEQQGLRLRRLRYNKQPVRAYLQLIEDADTRAKYLSFYDAHPTFEAMPAAARHHHWWTHGLADHVSEMIGMGLDLMELYPGDMQFSREDVVIACFLHDFAKCWAYRQITDEDRKKNPRLKEKQEFVYQEGAFTIVDHENKTLLELNKYGVPVTEKQWSAVLFAEGGYSSAHFTFRGLSSTSETASAHNHLSVFVHMLDAYSAQLLGRSIA